jgi:outer membrane protein OmpA-like peptidoglycan-associated protein
MLAREVDDFCPAASYSDTIMTGPMLRGCVRLLGLLVFLLAGASGVRAQSNQFRDARAHLSIGYGVFTYHGPIDLLQVRDNVNFVRESDPAGILLGSFPLRSDRFYFRGMVGMTNFVTDDGRALVAGFPDGQNEFLTEELFFFEPEIVMTLTPGSRSRILPYLFTGFGALLANPFGREERVDFPGTGIPGPERSVFALPIGAGIDLALTRRFSLFAEGSWRFDLNYVFRNEDDYDPHNTSLVMGGLRIGIPTFRRQAIPAGPERPIPPPMTIPPYRPALAPPLPGELPKCTLVELNTVFFARDGITLDDEARARLDENVDALKANLECCLEINGYTDYPENDPYALRMAQQRAEVVYQYYLSKGIAATRMKVNAKGAGMPVCGKEEAGPSDSAGRGTAGKNGCTRNRRVESIPITCQPCNC